ncbi:uncharacterized protein LOC142775976 isoform X2 [Rhipicephalus microplus]|uniref:uncharacterized protein LOC142775976 isoform X2 n=1 Tax=Rhipicephalus microplus TaxID=6941 RepID=UPI003F6A5AB4
MASSVNSSYTSTSSLARTNASTLLLCPGLSCQGHIVRGTSSADFSDGPGPLDGPHLVFKGLAEKGGLPSLSKTPHVAM